MGLRTVIVDGSEVVTYEAGVFNFGTFNIIIGTAQEVYSALRGSHNIKQTDFFWDGLSIVAVEPL